MIKYQGRRIKGVGGMALPDFEDIGKRAEIEVDILLVVPPPPFFDLPQPLSRYVFALFSIVWTVFACHPP